jgi:hypothetical protein
VLETNKTKPNNTKQTKRNKTNNACDLVVVMFRSVYKTRYHLLPRQARVGAIDCARKTQTKAGCYTAITMRSEKCGLNGFSNNGCLWNGMTAPFINYTIFGALWYQGNNYDAHFIAFYRTCLLCVLG